MKNRIEGCKVQIARTAGRPLHLLQRFERHANQQTQPLAFRLDERLHRHVIGNLVRSRVGRQEKEDQHPRQKEDAPAQPRGLQGFWGVASARA